MQSVLCHRYFPQIFFKKKKINHMQTRSRQLEYMVCYPRYKKNFIWENTHMEPPPPIPLP